MVLDKFSPLNPSTPARALFWINGILLIISVFFESVYFKNYELIAISGVGLVFALYLWYDEFITYPLIARRNRTDKGPNVWKSFKKRVERTLVCYIASLGALIILFIRLRL